MKLLQLAGKRFGRLLVIERAGSGAGKEALWKCLCDCGKSKVVRGRNMVVGDTLSCGCLHRDRTRETSTTHGCAKPNAATREYHSWSSMIARCENRNYHHYHRYGGRGITVCERWRRSFIDFLADMGPRPAGTTLDRINNNGNYEPENCRWATAKEQILNRGDAATFRRLEAPCA